MATNITWHANLTHQERAELRKQKGVTVWLTGLSASGKSTIACALEQSILARGLNSYRLDGDNIRFGLNKDLGFSEADRNENIRRISEVAKLFSDSCCITVTSFISPYRADRRLARELHEKIIYHSSKYILMFHWKLLNKEIQKDYIKGKRRYH